MLTSIVIDDLQRRYRTYPSIGIAYIYCDYRTRDEQTAERTLQSLLKQLVEQQNPISASVQQFWQDHVHQRPLLRSISRCLQSVVASFSEVFILIDALDECKVLDGCRTSFMWEMCTLQEVSRTHVLATTRHILHIIDSFRADQVMEVRASAHDVQMFIEGNLDSLPSFVRRNTALLEEIKATIGESVDGM
jgi:hypothetical protein